MLGKRAWSARLLIYLNHCLLVIYCLETNGAPTPARPPAHSPALARSQYFVMVNMVSLMRHPVMVRGLGEMLQQSRNLAVCWKPYAERALREKGTLTEVEAEIASWKRK